MQEELVKTEDNEEVEIDLKEVWFAVVNRWWVILLSVILGAMIGLIVGNVLKKTEYKAEAVYMMSYNSGNSSVSEASSEYSYTTKILSNCVTVVQQNKFMNIVAERVNEGIDEEDDAYISVDALTEYISYTYDADENTSITVSVTTDSAELSYKIISVIAGEYTDEDSTETLLSGYIKDNYRMAGNSSLQISLINELNMPEEPEADRSVLIGTLVGAAAALVISVIAVYCSTHADKRIKEESDITSKYNVPVLGTIPDFYDKELQNKNGYYSSYKSADGGEKTGA